MQSMVWRLSAKHNFSDLGVNPAMLRRIVRCPVVTQGIGAHVGEMSEPTALSRLRGIRDAQRRAQAMLPDRDELIREAIKREGHSERLVAEAAGLSPGRINQIVHRR